MAFNFGKFLKALFGGGRATPAPPGLTTYTFSFVVQDALKNGLPSVKAVFRLDDDSPPVTVFGSLAGVVTYQTPQRGVGVTVELSKDGYRPQTERRLLPMFTTTGPAPEWAAVTVLAFAAEAPVPEPPGTGASYRDLIDPGSVRVVNTFEDLLTWPIQVGIERVEINPRDGINVYYTDTSMWPDDNLDEHEAGGLVRFTLCAGFRFNGQWVLSAFFEYWAHEGRPRHNSGAHPLLLDPVWQADRGIARSNWLTNWADPGKSYPPPLSTFVPQPGDLMAICLVAGSMRMRKHKTVEGRSQIVTFPLTLTGEHSFSPA